MGILEKCNFHHRTHDEFQNLLRIRSIYCREIEPLVDELSVHIKTENVEINICWQYNADIFRDTKVNKK